MTIRSFVMLVLATVSVAVSPARATELQEAIAADYPQLEALFEHLHANPELSMQEFKTSERLANELQGFIGSQIVVALQSIVTREISPLEPALITVGAFRAGTAPNVITDQARLDITVRANTETTRAYLLDAIKRVATQTARAAAVPEGKLPEVNVAADGAPTTTNDAALARRVRAAMEAGMGADAFVEWQQTDMGAEDFPDLVNVDPPIPSVYFEVGGTPPGKLASGDWAEHHSPLFRIDPEASIKAGVEAMTLAALELLDEL